MAGFVVEAIEARPAIPEPLKAVDIGHCDIFAERNYGSARGAWAGWTGSRQLESIEDGGRLLFIEGQPDRLPQQSETVEHWLETRTGSFRGFQIERESGLNSAPRLTVFVDSMATRPVYLLAEPGRICFGDKVSAIVANSRGLECEWGA